MQESGSVSKRMKMWKFADGNLYFSPQTGKRPKSVCALIRTGSPELACLWISACCSHLLFPFLNDVRSLWWATRGKFYLLLNYLLVSVACPHVPGRLRKLALMLPVLLLQFLCLHQKKAALSQAVRAALIFSWQTKEFSSLCFCYYCCFPHCRFFFFFSHFFVMILDSHSHNSECFCL